MFLFFVCCFLQDLEVDLRKDTGGNFRTALLALIMNEAERLAYFVFKSIKVCGVAISNSHCAVAL